MTDETRQVLEVVKEMFEALNAKIDGLGTETKEIKTHVAKIETTLENDTNKKIQLLAEGYQSVGGIPEKMERLSEEVEAIKSDVDIIKKVVTTHSAELDKLGKAR